jgi:hypothetical protein
MHVRTAFLGLAATAFAVLLAAGPAGAADLCKEHPKAEWMKSEAVKSKAEAMGYQVRSVGEEDGCWEVKGTKEGKRVEAYFDPVTGEVVKVKGGS